MSKAQIEGVIDIYDKSKGQQFNGMVFVKFASVDERNVAIQAFNDSKTSFTDTRKYMNKDLPIQQRTSFSFFLYCKRLLNEWGSKNVQFDDASGILKVAGVPKIQVGVEDLTWNVAWIDKKWEKWEELKSDVEFKALMQSAQDKLTKATQSKGKGKVGPV